MAWLEKKDAEILLEAGFDDSDLGLVDCRYAKRGVEIYETPGDYFAKELIENACEQGLCDLYNESIPNIQAEPYDNSHKGVYDNDDYPGNEDIAIDVKQDMRPQVEWLKNINIGKLSVWQRRDDNFFKWPVKRIPFDMPIKEKVRMNRMSPAYKKILHKTYARDAWQGLWRDAVSTLYNKPCEKIEIGSRNKKMNLIVIDADDMKELGHRIPGEAKWITMLYFDKQKMQPQIRPRSHL